MKCLKDLNDNMIGRLRQQHELFNFKVEKEIGYLALHVEYVEMHFVDVCVPLCVCVCV